MRYANLDGNRVEPDKSHSGATCPACQSEVLAVCGSIKTWHWRHKSLDDCDSFSEGLTDWHIALQDWFPKEQQEICIGRHRADVVTSSGVVIEMQHSSISIDEVRKRHEFYTGEDHRLIWVLDGGEFWRNFKIKKNEKGYYTFRWSYTRETWLEAYLQLNSEIFIHYREKGKDLLFKINRIHDNRGSGPCGGSGKVWTKYHFVKYFGGEK